MMRFLTVLFLLAFCLQGNLAFARRIDSMYDRERREGGGMQTSTSSGYKRHHMEKMREIESMDGCECCDQGSCIGEDCPCHSRD